MNIRFTVLQETLGRRPVEVPSVSRRSEIFEQNVFTDEKLRQYVDKATYKAYLAAKDSDEGISRQLADKIAQAMKQWAMENGATHYTHWFQPLTGATAEKHDSFLEKFPDGPALETFSGDQLAQQEPDASSFPSGGLRNTFEARGYTAWDPGSPAFIYGTTLCIPTVFISYTGEALDYKTPLLRSKQVLNKYAVPVAQLFNRNVEKVFPTLGWEQEYFLVDKALYRGRPDLVLAGRTLLGHGPAKSQQLDDHYFGSIPARVMAFMRELEIEALKLGIPVKTRHNEVAPNQYEVAPVFEEANLAVDHNALLMDLMTKLAPKHNFEVLLHEKPFAGINGSGKHNNWSLMTDTGINLLGPGDTPKRNLRFLTFFVNVVKAVNDYEELLRASIASAGNDHRLGANEAPPAIISVFIGHHMTEVFNQIKKIKDGKLTPQTKTDVKLNVVGKIPEILLDNTDRNRTSPFAFTGNKFEIRAVGSTANCAAPMTILNTIMAQQLKKFMEDYEALRNKGLGKDEAILNVLKDYIRQSERILFEGNGYSDEWKAEAAKRGLSNHVVTPDALKASIKKEYVDMLVSLGVYSESEIRSRYHVLLEQYNSKLEIEARVLHDLVSNHIMPTVLNYQTKLAQNVASVAAISETMAVNNRKQFETLSQNISALQKALQELKSLLGKLENTDDEEAKAGLITGKVIPAMESLRQYADALEMQVDDEMWPLVKYREMLFTR